MMAKATNQKGDHYWWRIDDEVMVYRDMRRGIVVARGMAVNGRWGDEEDRYKIKFVDGEQAWFWGSQLESVK